MTEFEPSSSDRRRVQLPAAEIGVLRPAMLADEPGLTSTRFRDIVTAIRRHVWLIVIMTAAGAGLAAYLVSTDTLSYSSAAVLRLKDSRGALTGGLAGTRAEAVAGRVVDPVQSQVEILTSRSVGAQVVDSVHDLRVRPREFPKGLLGLISTVGAESADSVTLKFNDVEFSAWSARGQGRAAYGLPVDIGGFRFTVRQRPASAAGWISLTSRDDATKRFVGRVRVRPRPNTDIVDVAYTDLDPQRTQTVTKTLVEVFQGASAKAANQESVRRRKFLETQLAYHDSVLTRARAALSSFRGRQRAYSTRLKLSTEQASLSGLDVRREELDADRRVFQALLSQLDGGRVDPQQIGALMSAPGLASNPVVSDLFSQLTRYQAARDSLTSGTFGSTAANPDVQRLDQLIVSTQQKLVTAVRSVVASVNARLQSLDEMRARNATDFPALSATEEAEAGLVEQEESARQMVTQLRAEYEKARLAEAVEVGEVEILDPASPPVRVTTVGPVRKVAFGLAVGLALGVALACLLEHLNTSIRRREQVRTVLRLPELAVIPRVRTPTSRRLRADRGSARDTSRTVPSRGRALQVRGESLVSHDVRSIGSEAYRLLRTNLLFSIPGGSPRSVVITSAVPGDGKTTVASNLAATFARQGMDVLLLDCDLRRGRLHGLFKVARDPGITEVLTGKASLEEAVRATSVEHLSLLTTGAIPGNPGELVGGEACRALLASLVERYALVIVDTPPVLAAADAAVLSSLVDATLLVVRAGRTRELEAQTTLEHLAAVHARVVGVVLNDQDSELQEHGEYSTYYSRYYGTEA